MVFLRSGSKTIIHLERVGRACFRFSVLDFHHTRLGVVIEMLARPANFFVNFYTVMLLVMIFGQMSMIEGNITGRR